MEARSDNYGKGIVASVAKIGALQVLLKLSNFASFIVLARLLSPEAFGVVGAALIVVGFAELFTEAGIPATLIQRRILPNIEIRVALGLSLTITLSMYAALVLASPYIAIWIKVPEIEDIIPALGIVLPMMGVSGVSSAIAQRQRKAAALSFMQVCVGVSTTWFVTVPLATIGCYYWSLIIGRIVNETLIVVCSRKLAHCSFRPVWNLAIAGDLLSKSIGYFGSRFLGFLANQGDNVIISRAYGAGGLGQYSRAFRLMDYPTALYHTIVERVAFPEMSRMQGQQERLQRALLRGFAISSLIALPISVFFVWTSDQIVYVLLGSEWHMTGDILAVLGGFTFFKVTGKIFDTYLRSIGHVRALTTRAALYAVLLLGSAFAASRVSIIMVAWAVGFSIFVNWVMTLALAVRIARIGVGQLAACMMPSLRVSALIAAGLAIGTMSVWCFRGEVAWLYLLVNTSSFVGVGVLVFCCGSRSFIGDNGVWLQDTVAGMIRRRKLAV